MRTYRIDGNKISNWKDFHFEFKTKFNFPNYYGENLDAWIDCMDDIVSQETIVQIENSQSLQRVAPNIFQSLLECAAFVNFRKLESGRKPTLILSASFTDEKI